MEIKLLGKSIGEGELGKVEVREGDRLVVEVFHFHFSVNGQKAVFPWVEIDVTNGVLVDLCHSLVRDLSRYFV